MARNELDLKHGSHWGRPVRYNRSNPRKYAEGYDLIFGDRKAKPKAEDDHAGSKR